MRKNIFDYRDDLIAAADAWYDATHLNKHEKAAGLAKAVRLLRQHTHGAKQPYVVDFTNVPIIPEMIGVPTAESEGGTCD